MYRDKLLSDRVISISISESDDMAVLGLSHAHLRDAMTEIARHMLALGARLAYGGDLRSNGFSELLKELVVRHYKNHGGPPAIFSFLAWPVHACLREEEIIDFYGGMADSTVNLIRLSRDGRELSKTKFDRYLPLGFVEEEDWITGLTSMRNLMSQVSFARIALGGRITNYKGIMPGIAEEVLASLRIKQPVFLLGGFGGCSRDIAEEMGFIDTLPGLYKDSPFRREFKNYNATDLNNGLNLAENITLARTPHIDQAITLMLLGFQRLSQKSAGI